MANLPVIVSAGGINAAGRSTYYSDLERMVYDSLSGQAQQALKVELESLTQSDSASALENSFNWLFTAWAVGIGLYQIKRLFFFYLPFFKFVR